MQNKNKQIDKKRATAHYTFKYVQTLKEQYYIIISVDTSE